MRVLFDTNVLLDVLLAREPFARAAVELLALVDKGRIDGLLCATTVTTIHYLATKAIGSAAAGRHMRTLLDIFDIAEVNREVLSSSLQVSMKDFEDAVLHEAAIAADASGIVTRNVKDFAKSRIPIYAPEEFLALMQQAS